MRFGKSSHARCLRCSLVCVLGVVPSASYAFGNLVRETTVALVLQRGPAEYDLFLRPDLHTHGHTQWFYFAVRDTHPPGRCLRDEDEV